MTGVRGTWPSRGWGTAGPGGQGPVLGLERDVKRGGPRAWTARPPQTLRVTGASHGVRGDGRRGPQRTRLGDFLGARPSEGRMWLPLATTAGRPAGLDGKWPGSGEGTESVCES